MPQGKKNGSGVLTLDQIRDAQDLAEAKVEIPEWGGCVKVRGLDHGEVSDLIAQFPGAAEAEDWNDVKEFQIQLVIRGLVEPDLSEVPDAEEVLNSKSVLPVQRIAAKVGELSGLAQGAAEAAEKSFLAGK